MMAIFEISFLTMILVLGVTIAHSDESMLLYPIANKLDGKKWAKPLLTCEWCMPSVYAVFGYVGYWYIHGVDYGLLGLYPWVVCLSSLSAGFTWKVVILIQTKINANIKTSGST